MKDQIPAKKKKNYHLIHFSVCDLCPGEAKSNCLK